MDYFLLGVYWIVWSFFHSYLISLSFENSIVDRFGFRRYYRVTYNIFATLSLLVVVLYERSLPKEIIFSFDGVWIYIKYSLITLSLILFYLGAKSYDMFQFLGVRQIFGSSSHKTLSKDNEFKSSGILAYSRHPWYLAGIILLWSARDITTTSIISNTILTLYFIIGAYIEERKLVTLYPNYKDYQKRVSMFFGFKRGIN
jgi:protein-S-isoprenylcysteine O-methyltransferase Ste14